MFFWIGTPLCLRSQKGKQTKRESRTRGCFRNSLGAHMASVDPPGGGEGQEARSK